MLLFWPQNLLTALYFVYYFFALENCLQHQIWCLCLFQLIKFFSAPNFLYIFPIQKIFFHTKLFDIQLCPVLRFFHWTCSTLGIYDCWQLELLYQLRNSENCKKKFIDHKSCNSAFRNLPLFLQPSVGLIFLIFKIFNSYLFIFLSLFVYFS